MLRVWLGRVVAGGLCGVVALGCSGGSKGSGGGSEPPLAKEEYLASFHRAYCDAVGPCCVDQGIAYDRETCFQNAQLSGGVLPALQDPAYAYDASAARRCLNSFKARVAACKPYDESEPDAGCDEVFEGTLADGEFCGYPDQCRSGRCDTNTGKCGGPAPAARVAAGGACDGECYSTPQGPWCRNSRDGSKLSTAACYEEDELYCRFDSDSADLGAPGACTRLPKLGEDCRGAVCAEGYCELTTYLCTTRYSSGPCAMMEACAVGTSCIGLAPEVPGECKPPLADGMPCTRPSDCQSGACRGGTDAQSLCGKGNVATLLSCMGQ